MLKIVNFYLFAYRIDWMDFVVKACKMVFFLTYKFEPKINFHKLIE